MLCAPAVIVMVAVTAYPIGYAIYLSLERYIMSSPQLTKFVGLSNYGAVLSSPFWWHALVVTIIITVVSVAIEFVLGMAAGAADVPDDLGAGRGPHRSS